MKKAILFGNRIMKSVKGHKKTLISQGVGDPAGNAYIPGGFY